MKENPKRANHAYLILWLLIVVTILILPSIASAVETHEQDYSNMNVSLELNIAGPKVGYNYVFDSISDQLDGTDNDHSHIMGAGFEKLEPRKAFVRAIFPGFLFHGAGHQYAGQPGNGFLLLTAEIVSVPLIYIALHDQAFGGDPNNKNFGDLYTKSYFGFFGLNLFFGSWMYDMIAAPIKAKKLNEKHGLTVYPELDHDKVIVKLAVSL